MTKQINLPTTDEAGAIAVRMSENLTEKLTAQEQSFFIAGFQECIKYLIQETMIENQKE